MSMVHPIVVTVLRRPDLLFKHIANYAELVKAELSAVAGSLAVRAAAGAAAAVSLFLALGLTGIAVMLGLLHETFDWVLIAVPGVAWALAVVGVVIAMRPTLAEKVQDVTSELDADLVMLRRVKGEPR